MTTDGKHCRILSQMAGDRICFVWLCPARRLPPRQRFDVMVQFHPDARPIFRTLDQMGTELQTLFHREVDILNREGIETSRNYLCRHKILSSAQVIYATGSSIPV